MNTEGMKAKKFELIHKARIRAKFIERAKALIRQYGLDADIEKIIKVIDETKLESYGKTMEERKWNGETSELFEGYRRANVERFKMLAACLNNPNQDGTFFYPRLWDKVISDLEEGRVWPIFKKEPEKGQSYNNVLLPEKFNLQWMVKNLGISRTTLQNYIHDGKRITISTTERESQLKKAVGKDRSKRKEPIKLAATIESGEWRVTRAALQDFIEKTSKK